jgi:predicted CoA-binding protein
MTDIQRELPDCNPPSEEIAAILRACRTVAVVGLSPKEERDSHRVARYLMEQGYDIVPVNPGQREILGKPCYKSLKHIPFAIDLADLFLNPVRVPPVVDQAVEIGVKVIWMQLGIVENDAARKAREAGITVVMDRCIKQEHEKMIRRGTLSGPSRKA